MNYILNIHTSTEKAIVNINNGKEVLSTLINEDPKQHAAFLHTAIREILGKNNISASELKAVGATNGPGSYTGIRVGLATAKGLCYSLKIPLITFNTLEIMALSATQNMRDEKALYCPMIDARRMEVFTAVYDYGLNEIIPPSAMVIDENSFEKLLKDHTVYFFGNGSEKLKNVIKDPQNSYFINQQITSGNLAEFAWEKYENGQFDNVSYAVPLYLKEFYFAKK